MIVVYLFLGLLTAIIGALPMGASNIAVINTTLKQSTKQALKIAIAAGFAEVILSLYALHSNVAIKDFFDSHILVQVGMAILLFGIGLFLFFKKSKQYSEKKRQLKSKYTTGFLLGILNPPVLVYWVLIYGLINNSGSGFMLSLKSSLSILFMFFVGVYIGKLLTLYFYSKFSAFIKLKLKNVDVIVNKVTGILLTLVGALQTLKLYVFN